MIFDEYIMGTIVDPRSIAHGDATQVVPRLLRVSVTEEKVQGAHNQQPTGGWCGQ